MVGHLPVARPCVQGNALLLVGGLDACRAQDGTSPAAGEYGASPGWSACPCSWCSGRLRPAPISCCASAAGSPVRMESRDLRGRRELSPSRRSYLRDSNLATGQWRISDALIVRTSLTLQGNRSGWLDSREAPSCCYSRPGRAEAKSSARPVIRIGDQYFRLREPGVRRARDDWRHRTSRAPYTQS